MHARIQPGAPTDDTKIFNTFTWYESNPSYVKHNLPWPSAKVWYLQCISNGGNTVLRWAIDIISEISRNEQLMSWLCPI